MKSLFHSLLLFLAVGTGNGLACQIQYLKIENEILRSKLPKRIRLTRRERHRLVKYGKLVGAALKHLATIVTPRTFLRWMNEEKPAPRISPQTVGRPKTPEEIRELILRLAEENHWGYTRILGELRKLGVRNISRTTVANILREAGIDPSPERSKGTWSDFIRRHSSTLWACDFFSKKIWTADGLVDYFVLILLHVGSRRVIVTGMTAHPDARWMAQQARNFHILTADEPDEPSHLIHDFDTKFTAQFDSLIEAEGAEVVKVGPAAPNLNAYCERRVLSIRRECLDHFIVFGEHHLRHIIDNYLAHYLEERPHQSLGNAPLTTPAAEPPTNGQIVCRERLGGLLKHYQRKAA